MKNKLCSTSISFFICIICKSTRINAFFSWFSCKRKMEKMTWIMLQYGAIYSASFSSASEASRSILSDAASRREPLRDLVPVGCVVVSSCSFWICFSKSSARMATDSLLVLRHSLLAAMEDRLLLFLRFTADVSSPARSLSSKLSMISLASWASFPTDYPLTRLKL